MGVSPVAIVSATPLRKSRRVTWLMPLPELYCAGPNAFA